MKKHIVRCAAVMGFLGAALSLIWTGFSNAPARSNATSEIDRAKPPVARERADRLWLDSKRRSFARSISKQNQPAQSHAGRGRGIAFPIDQPWRLHAGAKVNPPMLALPEGTVMARGIPAHPNRVVARVKPGTSRQALEQALATLGSSVVSGPNAGGWATVNLPPAAEDADGEGHLLTGMKTLASSGELEAVEPDFLLSHAATPTDSAFHDGSLWGLHNTGQNGGTDGIDIGAAAAWDVTTGSMNLIVAVIDTGIRYTHQDLAGQMWTNPDEIPGNGVDDDGDGYVDNVYGIDAVNGDGDPMDDNNHGTHCAGTIGAGANNDHPHVGVAWNVRLMACKFLSADGWGYLSGAIECIDFAVANGAKVLSNSWGGGGFSQSLYDTIARARDAGVLFIAAAGNSGADNDTSPAYPASYDLANVISVAAIDRRGRLASWSNYGAVSVDLGAPGVDIYSTVASSDSAYALYSGTSMATPHVSGMAALLWANDISQNASAVKDKLLNTSLFLDDLDGRTVSGGLAHAGNALNGGDDGELELTLTVSENPLRGGRTAAVFARVTDVTPVTGASVTGDANGAALEFADDGEAPDASANDGTYTAALAVPADPSLDQLLITASASATGKNPANAVLSVPVIHPPANDNFTEAAGLSGRQVFLRDFTNRAATAEDGEPRHYWFRPQKSVWFTWTAPRTGRADLWLRGSDFDTVLAVYRGGNLTSLRRVARDDDSGGRLTSRCRFWARRGQQYHFAVDGWGGAEGEIQGRLVVRKRKPIRRGGRHWWQRR